MKYFLTLLALLLPGVAMAKLNVVTTIPDLAAIAQEIGGDKITVKSIARGDEDPHFLEPKPSYILIVNHADLLIEVGLQLEIGWLPVLITQSRNPKIQTGMHGRMDASEKIPLLEIPVGAIDRSQGDVHPDGNPHYWLNPQNGLVIAQEIAEHLSQLDPVNKDFYGLQLQTFQTKLKNKIVEWQKLASPLKGKTAVAYHKTTPYLADWLGLKIVDFIEPKPGIPPSPSHILALMDEMTKQKVPWIITASYYDMKAARELSEKTGAKVLVLPSSVGGNKEVSTYEELFDYLIAQLKGAS